MFLCIFCCLGVICYENSRGEQLFGLLDNNLRCVDLSDLTSSVPLSVTESFQILWRTEAWEHNTFDQNDNDSIGYPSIVKNDRGNSADNKYYLYYSHHDPGSGIGCAVAEKIEGPYTKLANMDPNRKDSIVLATPHYQMLKQPFGDPSHF